MSTTKEEHNPWKLSPKDFQALMEKQYKNDSESVLCYSKDSDELDMDNVITFNPFYYMSDNDRKYVDWVDLKDEVVDTFPDYIKIQSTVEYTSKTHGNGYFVTELELQDYLSIPSIVDNLVCQYMKNTKKMPIRDSELNKYNFISLRGFVAEDESLNIYNVGDIQKLINQAYTPKYIAENSSFELNYKDVDTKNDIFPKTKKGNINKKNIRKAGLIRKKEYAKDFRFRRDIMMPRVLFYRSAYDFNFGKFRSMKIIVGPVSFLTPEYNPLYTVNGLISQYSISIPYPKEADGYCFPALVFELKNKIPITSTRSKKAKELLQTLKVSDFTPDTLKTKRYTLNDIKDILTALKIYAIAYDITGNELFRSRETHKGIIHLLISGHHIYHISTELKSIFCKLNKQQFKLSTIEFNSSKYKIYDDIEVINNMYLDLYKTNKIMYGWKKSIYPRFIEGKVRSFTYDTINHVYNPDHDDLLDVCNTLKMKYNPCYTWDTISHNLFSLKESEMTSNFNKHTYKYYQKLSPPKNFGTVNKKCNSIDINGSYPRAMITNSDRYPIFSVYDYFRRFSNERYMQLEQKDSGHYYVRTTDKYLFGHSGIFSSQIIEVAIKYNIKFEITHAIFASKFLPCDYLKEMVLSTYDVLDYRYCKKVNNSLHGFICKSKDKASTQCVFQHEDDLQHVLSWFDENKVDNISYEDIDTFNLRVDEIDNHIYILDINRTSNRFNNSIPIAITYMSRQYIDTFEALLLVGIDHFQFIKTDCIGVDCDISHLDLYPLKGIVGRDKFLQIKFKSESTKIGFEYSYFNNEPEPFMYEMDVSPLNDSSDVLNELKLNLQSCHINSLIPGCGKSYILKELYNHFIPVFGKDKIKKVALTNVASKNINGETLHKIFGLPLEYTHIRSTNRSKLMNIKLLLIDEVYMIDPKIISFIYEIFNENKDLIIIIAGEYKQLPYICANSNKNYQSDPGSLYGLIARNNKVRKYNLSKCQRSLDALTLSYYRSPNLYIDLPKYDIRKLLDLGVRRFLVYENKHRFTINKIVDEYLCKKYPKSKYIEQTTSHNDKEYDTGFHLTPETIKMAKSTSTKYAKNEIVPTSDDSEKNIVMANAMTIHKSQGLTINEKYAIINPESFKYCDIYNQLLYVAITRCTDIKNVYILLLNDV